MSHSFISSTITLACIYPYLIHKSMYKHFQNDICKPIYEISQKTEDCFLKGHLMVMYFGSMIYIPTNSDLPV